MTTADSITVEVRLGVSEETAKSCIAILNEWLKENGNRVLLCEREDGTTYLEAV